MRVRVEWSESGLQLELSFFFVFFWPGQGSKSEP